MEQEQPPLFKKWSTWYWIVLGALAAQIVLYYIITASFA